MNNKNQEKLAVWRDVASKLSLDDLLHVRTTVNRQLAYGNVDKAFDHNPHLAHEVLVNPLSTALM